jgi:hypothetical protein
MRELSAMRMLVTLAAIVTLAGLPVADAGMAQALAQTAPQSNVAAAKTAAATDISAQRRVRPRARIRVQPLYPYRRYHSFYPLPYDVEYPGPNARRECTARYITEYRPSGTVVVPRMNCWWVRG